jgi:hypothetical protein
MKMLPSLRPLSLVVLCGALLPYYAKADPEVLAGDYHIQAIPNGDPGNLEVDGELSVGGGRVDLGTTTILSVDYSALTFKYTEASESHKFTIMATQPGVTFVWQDGGSETAKPKMELDGANILKLYKSNGTPGIILDPLVGGITLSGTGTGSGITLGDGTLLRTATDLRASALYNTSGQQVLKVNPDGTLSILSATDFFAPFTVQGSDAFGGTDITRVKNALAKMGYGQASPEVTLLGSGGAGGGNSIGGIKSDSSGNTYIWGTFQGAINFGSVVLNSTGYSTSYVVKFNTSGSAVWAQKIEGASLGGVDVDPSGSSVVIAGGLWGTMKIGASTLTSNENADLDYVAKLNGASGSVIWLRSLGDNSAADIATKVCVNASGKIAVVGYYWNGPMTIDSQVLNFSGSQDFFVTSLNSSGELIWAANLGSDGSGDDVTGVSMDSLGNVAVVGIFSGAIGPDLNNSGNSDSFVMSYGGGGSVSWSIALGSDGSSSIGAVATDASGNVIIGGDFSGSMTLGEQTYETSGGSGNGLLVKLNSGGGIVWVFQVAGSGTVRSLKVDSSGSILAGGSFSGTTTFGSYALTSQEATDGFVAKWNPSGGVSWARAYGGKNTQYVVDAIEKSSGLQLVMNSSPSSWVGGRVIPSGYSLLSVPNQALTVTVTPATASFSWGSGQAGSSGSVALGDMSVASGTNSIALGQGAMAAGINSFSAGLNSRAMGSGSVTLGYGAQAVGNFSTALGYSTQSGGQYSTAFGYNTQAMGNFSTAFGTNTQAVGDYSTAFGSSAQATGYGSIAFGSGHAQGASSTAFGYGAQATGQISTAFGNNTQATGDWSTAFGKESQATGIFSTAFGYYTVAQAPAQVVIGHYNIPEGDAVPSNTWNLTTWPQDEPLFIIGNGTSAEAPSDAFVVRRNGDAKVSGKLEVGGLSRIRVEKQGDLSMGGFTHVPTP